MNDKEAVRILTSLLKKDGIHDDEREALLHAIGILSWTMLHEGTLRNYKRRQDEKRRTD